MSVGRADDLNSPISVSLEVLTIVATKNTRLSIKSTSGKASHPQLICTNLVILYASPESIKLVPAFDRKALVKDDARLSIWRVTLFGANHGLKLRGRVHGPAAKFLNRRIGFDIVLCAV